MKKNALNLEFKDRLQRILLLQNLDGSIKHNNSKEEALYCLVNKGYLSEEEVEYLLYNIHNLKESCDYLRKLT